MTFNYDSLTPEHFAASINWISKMSAETRWNLTTDEAAILIGMNLSEYIEIQKMASDGRSFSLQAGTAERLSLLLGTFRRLQLMGLDERTATPLFNKANNGGLLAGKSIKNFLLESNSLAAFYAVNVYLDASIAI